MTMGEPTGLVPGGPGGEGWYAQSHGPAQGGLRICPGLNRMTGMKKTIFLIILSLGIMSSLAHAGQAVIRLEEPVGLDRTNWPVGLGFPFAKGELKDLASLVVLTPEGRPVQQ